ncbi:MAG: outer membrane beta-barrel protein [Fibrobacter sp.]|nr:outer membrane beta-barrel protein [Fibrobacter sp.]
MKKFLLALTLLCSAIFAQPEDSDFTYWPRTYFASIGFNVIANRGDLFDRAMVLKDDGIDETVHLPNTKVIVSPDYNIGVNIREFTLAASFQYWTMQGSIPTLPAPQNEQDMRFWRFGLEGTYNFFYPDFFQVGVGLGYSFSKLTIKDNVSNAKGFFDSELNGSAIALVTQIRYFITDNFGLTSALRIYENWYKSVHTKNSGTVDFHELDISYYWQTYIAVSIGVMVQF